MSWPDFENTTSESPFAIYTQPRFNLVLLPASMTGSGQIPSNRLLRALVNEAGIC